jgi:hypothetical protein
MLSPQQLLDDFSFALPGFSAAWDDPENLFREEDGSFTHCGVFSSVSHYLRDRAADLSDDQWRAVGSLVEKYFAAGDELRGCLGACLIENMEFEEYSPIVRRHVPDEILRHFHFEGRS